MRWCFSALRTLVLVPRVHREVTLSRGIMLRPLWCYVQPFPKMEQYEPKVQKLFRSGECNSFVMLPLATHCHMLYHLHPFHFVLFKFKDLGAKQHPTDILTGSCCETCMCTGPPLITLLDMPVKFSPNLLSHASIIIPRPCIEFVVCSTICCMRPGCTVCLV